MVIESLDNASDQSAAPSMRELAVEAQFILSALEAGGPTEVDRRRGSRLRYRVEAELSLAADGTESAPRPIYTRDLTPLNLGFVSPSPVPLGSSGMLHLPAPDGRTDVIPCNVIRCREVILGWFDCAVRFKEQNHTIVARPQ